MEIPKYIEEKLNKRAALADKLFDLDMEITEWIHKNNIEVDSGDYNGGVEMYVHPYESCLSVKEAIRNHKKERK